jgi:hypothetical protein
MIRPCRRAANGSKNVWQARSVEVALILRMPSHWFLQDGACRVDENVHLSEVIQDAIAEPLDGASLEHVGRHRHRASAERLHLGACHVDKNLPTTGRHDVRAGFGETTRDRAANS